MAPHYWKCWTCYQTNKWSHMVCWCGQPFIVKDRFKNNDKYDYEFDQYFDTGFKANENHDAIYTGDPWDIYGKSKRKHNMQTTFEKW